MALLVAGPAALLWRRRHPVAVLWFTAAITLLYRLLGLPDGPVFVAVAIAYFTCIAKGHRATAAVAAVTIYVGFLWGPYLLGRPDAPETGDIFGIPAWLIAIAAAAEVLRSRRQQASEARQRRREQEQRRASEERVRIARELHDVLAHNISLINVQAGVALHLMDKDPEQARTALAAIKEESRGALQEVRSVLGVLRRADERAPRAPAPTLARLDTLVASMDAAGIEVSLATDGKPHPLPAQVDLAAFRIVQEALTNVARHAGTSTARVRLGYGEDHLTVEVENKVRGPIQTLVQDTGNGIAGMRERTLALGGEFLAGPRPSGGFHVWARLPIERQT